MRAVAICGVRAHITLKFPDDYTPTGEKGPVEDYYINWNKVEKKAREAVKKGRFSLNIQDVEA